MSLDEISDLAQFNLTHILRLLQYLWWQVLSRCGVVTLLPASNLDDWIGSWKLHSMFPWLLTLWPRLFTLSQWKNPFIIPQRASVLSSQALLARGVRGFFPCVWVSSCSQENFFHFLSIQLLPGKKKYLTQTESFLFEFLCNLLFYQFVILLISLSCTKAFIRIIIRELSDYFVVMTNWVVLCPAWWMGWIFLHSSGRQSLVVVTLMILLWYVKQRPSMSAV